MLFSKHEDLVIDQNILSDLTEHSVILKKEHQQHLSKTPNKISYWKSLDKLSSNKSPGPDGLPASFYKTFWPIISGPLLECFQESIEYGELSESQKQSKICFILKKGRDPKLIKSWRPLSLMNIDTKIFSGMIKEKLDSILPSIISDSQVGFMHDKFIGENSLVIQATIHHSNLLQDPAAIISLDIESAFDTVSHEYMFHMLEKQGFPHSFLNLISTLYKGAQSCITNAGWSSRFFALERSCRQGCPLSPSLFNICIDPFIRSILNSNSISYKIFDNVIKTVAYADESQYLFPTHTI
jgi:hypothetical protein